MTFKYHLRDKRTGKVFERNLTIDAESKTEARKILFRAATRDVPRDARNYGFIPFRDWEIVWCE
jgi:hypothetical protein